MKPAILTLALVGLIGTAAIDFLHSWPAAYSFALGSLVMLINLSVMLITWPRILNKKQIAPSVAVIVFKFAILGWIIYEVVNDGRIHLGWFAAGLATIVPAAIATMLAPETTSN